MNALRKVLGVLVVSMLAAFALPALAHGDDEKFTFTTDGSATSGVPFAARIKNVTTDDDDKFKSFTITSADPNVRITAATITGGTGTYSSYTPPTIPAGGVTSVTFKNVSVAKTKYLDVALTATFPAATSCGSTPYVWNPKAYEGSNGSGDQFALVSSPASVRTTSITNLGTLTLAYVAQTATSVANGTQFTVTVQQTSSCSRSSFPDVTLTGPSGFTAGSAAKTSTPTTQTTTFTGNVYAFTPPTPPASPPTSLTLTAADANSTNSPLQKSFLVLAATVAQCGPLAPTPNPPAGAYFDVSCSIPANAVSGLAAGYRGPEKNSSACPAVNYSLTNNICFSVNQTDANGKVIPPNAVSFVWDGSLTAAFTYTVSWKPEFVDANGFPSKKTYYCAGPGATPCDVKKPLKACLGTNIAFSSIPSVPTQEPACSPGEDWATVAQTQCGGTGTLALPNPNEPACVVVTSTIIDAFDPPMLRD